MAITLKRIIGVTYKSGDATISAPTSTYTGPGASEYKGSIPDASTDLTIDFNVDVSAVVTLLLYSTKNMTLKFYNGASLVVTLLLTAGVPIVWADDHTETCPITGDCTKVKVTNASGAVADLVMDALMDTSPSIAD